MDVRCSGVPTIRWTFMSGLVSRAIGTWQPGGPANITADYSSRVQACSNGSLGLADLRLQDAGYYVVTVEDGTGSSRDAGLVLRVNGETLGPDSLSRLEAFLWLITGPSPPQRCCTRTSSICPSLRWDWPE